MRLADLGLTLGDVDLGGIDAESDYNLAEYFVTTPYVASALSGRRTLFLGRKGSGKSALFTQMPRLVEEAGRGMDVVEVTPDQYAWASLKGYKEQGLLPEQAHTNAWRLTLAIEVAGTLVSTERSWGRQAAEAVDALRRFIGENFGDLRPGLAVTATSLLKGLKSLNLQAFGFGLGFDRTIEDQPITPAVVDRLFAMLGVALNEHGVLVELDRLDDSWDGSAESQTLLIGLLKAGKELNDRFGARNGDDRGIRLLTFLRSDIYDGLKFDDKDKHRSTEEHIVWSAEELREMLQRRLPENATVDELFEPGDMRGSLSPFSYIVKRTFLRPREVLQFIDECIRQAGTSAHAISKDDVRAAEERYSHWKVEDLKQEFSKVAPYFERLIESLRQEVHRYDSIEELDTLLRRKNPELVDDVGARRLMEVLFETSVIGIRLGGTGSTRFKAESPDLVLPEAGAVYVHQSLYKGLNVIEARRSAGGPPPTEEDVAVADS